MGKRNSSMQRLSNQALSELGTSFSCEPNCVKNSKHDILSLRKAASQPGREARFHTTSRVSVQSLNRPSSDALQERVLKQDRVEIKRQKARGWKRNGNRAELEHLKAYEEEG